MTRPSNPPPPLQCRLDGSSKIVFNGPTLFHDPTSRAAFDLKVDRINVLDPATHKLIGRYEPVGEPRPARKRVRDQSKAGMARRLAERDAAERNRAALAAMAAEATPHPSGPRPECARDETRVILWPPPAADVTAGCKPAEPTATPYEDRVAPPEPRPPLPMGREPEPEIQPPLPMPMNPEPAPGPGPPERVADGRSVADVLPPESARAAEPVELAVARGVVAAILAPVPPPAPSVDPEPPVAHRPGVRPKATPPGPPPPLAPEPVAVATRAAATLAPPPAPTVDRSGLAPLGLNGKPLTDAQVEILEQIWRDSPQQRTIRIMHAFEDKTGRMVAPDVVESFRPKVKP